MEFRVVLPLEALPILTDQLHKLGTDRANPSTTLSFYCPMPAPEVSPLVTERVVVL